MDADRRAGPTGSDADPDGDVDARRAATDREAVLTGAVLVPLLVASVAGALTLMLCLLTERDTSTAS